MKLQTKVVFIFMIAIGCSALLLLRRSTEDMLWTNNGLRQPVNSLLSKRFAHQTLVQGNSSGLEISPSRYKTPKVNTHSTALPNKSDSHECLYKDYNLKRPRTIFLTEDKTDYFILAGGMRCLREGTENVTAKKCTCKSEWHGTACSIPDLVNESEFLKPQKLHLRPGAPRRIIYGITFNMEFEMLEIRLEEMGDLIDVILVLESNFTGFGDRKDLLLLNRMRTGFLKRFQQKIVYLYLDYFPTNPANSRDGLYTDSFMKNYPSKAGLGHVQGTRTDDLFIFADADEIHRREALLFLKLHDGYPEPFGVKMNRYAFGFYWSSGESNLGIGCTLEMLKDVYHNKSSDIRGATSDGHIYTAQLNAYKEKGKYVQMWQMGKTKPSTLIGGWHCSWCFEPERVRVKLLSAFNYDFPRWGNFPDKTKIDYITNLIRKGQWFDDQTSFSPLYMGMNVPYAPSYVLKNMSRYRYLLLNPYKPL